MSDPDSNSLNQSEINQEDTKISAELKNRIEKQKELLANVREIEIDSSEVGFSQKNSEESE